MDDVVTERLIERHALAVDHDVAAERKDPLLHGAFGERLVPSSVACTVVIIFRSASKGISDRSLRDRDIAQRFLRRP